MAAASCFLLLLLSFSALAQAQLSADALSLLEFKKGISQDPTGVVRTTWSPVAWGSATAADSCPRSWHGVSCDESGAVVTIALVALGLSGDLKLSTIAGMTALRNLSLAGNYFTGRLVPAIGAMTSLQHLDLSRNRFYGPIPRKITNLWGLVHLNLSWNGFKGGFPSGIQNLQQLRVLDLRSNELWGDVGSVLSDLRYVEHLDLSRNNFYGGLYMDSRNLSSLGNTAKYMNLSFNRLSGQFFSNESMGLFKSLEIMDLGHNQLTGELPFFGSLFNLKILRAGKNLLHGRIPEDLFGDAMQLIEIDLNGNEFTGSIHSISSSTLKLLDLSSNSLSGRLPSNLANCRSVDLSKNLLSGDIMAVQNWSYTMEVIKLSSNELSGFLPPALGRNPKLSTVDLSQNKLTGSVLSSFFTSSTLTYLNLSGNRFNGSIPLESYNNHHLQSLDLSNNLLSGSLPVEMSELKGLELLDLSVNHFDGRIPDLLQPDLKVFNVSYNDLSGRVPPSLLKFPVSSFLPGNNLLVFPGRISMGDNNSAAALKKSENRRDSSKAGIRAALAIGSAGAVVVLVFLLFLALRKKQSFGGRFSGVDVRFNGASTGDDHSPTSMSFSNDRLLASAGKDLSAELLPGIPMMKCQPSPSSHVVDSFISEQPAPLEVHSPDRLLGELFFLDLSQRTFTAEELSRAPAEVMGRSSLGTSYKATLDGGHVLTVKWLRAGLVKHKKEFAKEAKRVGTISHPNIISCRGFYWGSNDHERLLIFDYSFGDNLALYLYESTPSRYARLSVRQRLKVAIDVARCLHHLHTDRGLPHGNLKPSNILLTGPDLTAKLTDYALHRLLTTSSLAEQILNLGALGYRAPELMAASRPSPSFKADVYSFGVILMELLTRKSAGDIISGQPGAVDLTDWVQTCTREGRGTDCFDRDIAGLEEDRSVMDRLLAVSLKCILPVNERPNIQSIFQELCSIIAM